MFVRKRRWGGDGEKSAHVYSASEEYTCRRTSVGKARAPWLGGEQAVKAQSPADGCGQVRGLPQPWTDSRRTVSSQ